MKWRQNGRQKSIGNLIARSGEIKILLKSWRGMTLSEAWGPDQEKLQAELWNVGRLINRVKIG